MHADQKKTLLALAREAIDTSFTHGAQVLYTQLQAREESPFIDRRGCFVTLRKPDGSLRGCIGNLLGRGTVLESVVAMAREAAFGDPRFTAMERQELERTIIEISLLSRPQQVKDPERIVVGRDGVILTYRGRQAVFLPQVAVEQGWDLPTMLSHLSMKAGLQPAAYRQTGCHFKIFQAEVFSDVDYL